MPQGYDGLPPFYLQSSNPITANLGLSLKGMDPIVAEDLYLIDTAFGSINATIDVNGVAVPAPANFVNSATATFSVVGSNVSITVSSGTVTSFSAGTLSPLFTTSVATATTTPALSFSLNTQAAATVFSGPATGVAAAPTFRALVATDIPALPYLPSGTVLPATTTRTAHSFFSSYSASTGAFGQSQPAVADLSDTPAAGQVLAGPATGAAATATFRALVATDIPALAYLTNPMTTLGDMIYENATPAPAALSGNITTTKEYLSQTGTGTISAAPVWAQINYADIAGTTPTPPSGAVLWSALGNAAGALTLANAGYATTFNQTSAVNWTWANTTAATATVPQNSPILNLSAQYWNGAYPSSASAADTWTIQDVISTKTFAVTNVIEAAGTFLVTLVVTSNTLVLGQNVLLSGFTTATWLNGYVVTLTQAYAAQVQFTDPSSHGAQLTHAETATLTPQSSILTFTQSGLTPGVTAGSAVQVPALGIGAQPIGSYKIYQPSLSSTMHQAFIAGTEFGTDGNGSYLWLIGSQGTMAVSQNQYSNSGGTNGGSLTFWTFGNSLGGIAVGSTSAASTMGNAAAMVFGNNPNFTNSALDTGIGRTSPAVMSLGNGKSGDVSGTLIAANFAGNLLGSVTLNSLANPAVPTITKAGAGTGTTWGYKVIATDLNSNTTAASTEGTVSNAATLTPAVVNTITLAAPIVGAVSYSVYRTTVGTTPSTTGLLKTFALTSIANVSGQPLTVVDPGQCTLSSVATGSGIYQGTFTGIANNALVGETFLVAGFTNSANNGTFICTANTASQITLANASSVSESHAATATTVASGALPAANTTGALTVNGTIAQPSGAVTSWNLDAGLSRLGAASLAIGNGTAGDKSGQVACAVVRNTGFTVALLPSTAATGMVEGAVAYATNGLKVGETTGNGTGVPVYYSNGHWRVYSTDLTVAA